MNNEKMHYIAVSLDSNYNNIIIMGFLSDKKAEKAIENIQALEHTKYGCTWYSIDYYGYSNTEDVLNYYRNNKIVYFTQRKTSLGKKAIEHILQKLEN